VPVPISKSKRVSSFRNKCQADAIVDLLASHVLFWSWHYLILWIISCQGIVINQFFCQVIYFEENWLTHALFHWYIHVTKREKYRTILLKASVEATEKRNNSASCTQ
jgi:hypothetical protein